MYGRIHVLKKLTAAGVIAAAASGVMLLAGPASADPDTRGDGGVLSGNQLIAPISIPVDVCGNSLAVIGLATGHCRGGAAVAMSHRHNVGLLG
jgi:hypothetical protein